METAPIRQEHDIRSHAAVGFAVKPSDLDLTVIVASVDCRRSIIAAVQSVLRSCSGMAAEVIVVDASVDSTGEIAKAAFPQIELLCEPAGTLVPELWARGIAEARGKVVALTIGQCVVGDGWAAELLSEIRDGAAGVGGAFQLDKRARATDRAIFLLRYSAFLAALTPAAREVRDIAGDNAAYRRDLLEAHAESWRHGFWEIDFHRRLNPKDGPLRLVPGAIATFRAHARLRSYCRQRLDHGRHFGAWRVTEAGEHALRIIAAAPLVPFVLLSRIGRRALRGAATFTFLTALPLLFMLAVAWAVGELLGAISALRAPQVANVVARESTP